MDSAEALDLIRQSLDAVKPGAGGAVTAETHLVDDNILDSLDVMSFLFELEQALGHKIAAITDEYDDFRVASLIALVQDS